MFGLGIGDYPVFFALGPLAGVLLGVVLPSVISAVGMIASSRSSSRANREATAAQTAANERALQYEREQDARDRADRLDADEENRRRADIEADREQARFDAEQADARRAEAQNLVWMETRDRRLAPYRDTGVAALNELGRLAGLSISPSSDTPDMTDGWGPDNLSPPRDVPPVAASGQRGMSSLLTRR